MQTGFKDRLTTLTNILLDPNTPLSHAGLAPVLNELADLFGDVSGIQGAARQGKTDHLYLDTGLALGYQYAADCTRDPLRTTKYLRAIERTILKAREKFPGQTIHVLYAGTGPYAPFAFPLFTRFTAEEVRFTLLEVFRESIDSILRLARAFGTEKHIARIVQADATKFRNEGDPFHIAVAECLQYGLNHESQVAITFNLGPQLHPEGWFIPQRISIDAVLNRVEQEARHPDRIETAATRIHLGRIFELSRELWSSQAARAAVPRIPIRPISFPEQIPEDFGFVVLTTLHLDEELVLAPGESGITCPDVQHRPGPLRGIAELRGAYVIGPTPGFVFERVPRPSLAAAAD